jgi:hypothetical protein
MSTVSSVPLGGRPRTLLGDVRRALASWRAGYAFYVRIDRRGAVHVDRGSMRPQLLAALCGLFAELDLRSGWVAGVQEGARVRLILCDRWSIDVRQRVRDAWSKFA